MKKFILLISGLLTACSPGALTYSSAIPTAEPAQVVFAATALDSTSFLQDEDQAKTGVLLEELKTLAEQRQADLVSQPGWLYLRTRLAGVNNELFINWGIDLEQYEEERWVYLDDTGKMTRAVNRSADEDQDLLQTSLLIDGVWRNLTLGAESPADNAAPFDSNYGFYRLAARLVELGRQIHRDTIYHDCWYQGERYTVSDGVNYYEAVFNPGRRSLRWLKTWQIKDGALVLMNSLEMMVEKRISEPPADVLSLLDN